MKRARCPKTKPREEREFLFGRNAVKNLEWNEDRNMFIARFGKSKVTGRYENNSLSGLWGSNQMALELTSE